MAILSDLTARVSARVQALKEEDPEAGMLPSEYAMTTAFGAGCVGILYKFFTSEHVMELLKKMILAKLHL